MLEGSPEMWNVVDQTIFPYATTQRNSLPASHVNYQSNSNIFVKLMLLNIFHFTRPRKKRSTANSFFIEKMKWNFEKYGKFIRWLMFWSIFPITSMKTSILTHVFLIRRIFHLLPPLIYARWVIGNQSQNFDKICATCILKRCNLNTQKHEAEQKIIKCWIINAIWIHVWFINAVFTLFEFAALDE